MTFITVFSDLRKKFPVWSDLSDFLKSDAGGRLTIIEKACHPNRAIIRYVKGVSAFEIPYVPMFKSVIWDTVANIPVSVAPFKSSEGDPRQCVDIYHPPIFFQEFVEGTMLHAYRTYEDSELHLSTRTVLGATTQFYAKRDFSELVKDCPEYATLATCIPSPTFTPTSLEGIPYTFASLVLQHPAHRIVTPELKPCIYIVSLGAVFADGTMEIEENPERWPAVTQQFAPTTDYNGDKYLRKIMEGGYDSFWWEPGFVIKNADTLQRWVAHNQSYVIIKALRGQEADMYARFARLRQNGQLYQYLCYYQDDMAPFHTLEYTIQGQARKIVEAVNTKSLKTIGWPLKNIAYALQKKVTQGVVTQDDVMKYIQTMTPYKLRALLITPIGGETTTNIPVRDNLRDNTEGEMLIGEMLIG